jgi:hypothetical protein
MRSQLPKLNWVLAVIVAGSTGVILYNLANGQALNEYGDAVCLICLVVLAFMLAAANVTNAYLIGANKRLR